MEELAQNYKNKSKINILNPEDEPELDSKEEKIVCEPLQKPQRLRLRYT